MKRLQFVVFLSGGKLTANVASPCVQLGKGDIGGGKKKEEIEGKEEQILVHFR